MEAVAVKLARSQWEEGSRRFEEAVKHDPRLLDGLDAVIDDLRRRVGQTFTLSELAASYGDADRWVLETLEVAEPPPGWPARSTAVQDAAFHLYSRGAVDYRP